MSGNWLQVVRIATPRATEDAVAELLGTVFAHPSSVHADLESGVTRAEVFLPPGRVATKAELAALRAGLKHLRACGLDPGTGRVAVARLRQQDWAESWKRHFPPMEFGRALLIKPSWSRRRPRHGQAVVVIDPGLSFGTGRHATTSYCLRELVVRRNSSHSQSFLDMGTGSGILALAAAKLGYDPVAAFDFDPDAVRIANENAARNRAGHKLKIRREDLTRQPVKSNRRYDLVCANLMADLLVREAARIVNRLAPGGALVLAGILDGQFAEVQARFERAGLRLLRSRREREWRSGVFAWRQQAVETPG